LLVIRPCVVTVLVSVTDPFQEPLKKRVGGSLSALPLLDRLEMLRTNAWMIRGTSWTPPDDDGTLVRKVVGLTLTGTGETDCRQKGEIP